MHHSYYPHSVSRLKLESISTESLNMRAACFHTVVLVSEMHLSANVCYEHYGFPLVTFHCFASRSLHFVRDTHNSLYLVQNSFDSSIRELIKISNV